MQKKMTTKAKRMVSIKPLLKIFLGGVKLFALFFISCFAIGCEQLSDLEKIVDEKLDKDKENAIRVFEAELHPLNNSGVSGKFMATYVVGGNIQVEVNARNLAPEKVHVQHIHTNSECPPGPVFIPLDDNLVPLAAEDFPMANKNGQLNYAQRAKLSQFMAALNGSEEKHADEYLNLGHRTVQIHGAYVKDNMIVPAGTEGAEYDPSIPVACGEINEVY